MIFSKERSSENRPPGHAEPEYAYLDASGRPEAGRVRALLEEWFTHYPEEARNQWLAAFRSGNDTLYKTSAFELYLHEILLRLGYKVDVHPEVGGVTSRRPDFLARTDGTDQFFLEAVLATDTSQDEVAAQARVNAVFDVVEKIYSRRERWRVACG